MRSTLIAAVAVAVLALAGAPAALAKKGHHHQQHAAPGRGIGHYVQRNLVADRPGRAETTDPSLVNGWGLAFGPTTPGWVADNGTGVSTLYSGGVAGSAVTKVPLTVTIPGGDPTGAVFNDSTVFPVMAGTSSGPARFIFDSETGSITAWMQSNGTQAQTEATVPDAVFKGLAIANTATGPQIYATDFHHGTVDVWNGAWAPVSSPGAFQDPKVPHGFAPFGIQAVNGDIVVTYAKQDAQAHDDVAGAGNGFVDVFDTSGTLLRRLVRHGHLNSPWGVALAPQGFGPASGALLIGNFGDGRIGAYDPVSGKFLGTLRGSHGKRIVIDGLWSLQFGNGVIGTPRALLFTAGPDNEAHGLFGELTSKTRR